MDAVVHASTDNQDSPISLVGRIVSGVLTDEGFTLPTKESKLCLQIATALSETFRQRSQSCLDHSKWLVEQLNTVIDKAKKRGSQLMKKDCGAPTINCAFQALLKQIGSIFLQERNFVRSLYFTNTSQTKLLRLSSRASYQRRIKLVPVGIKRN